MVATEAKAMSQVPTLIRIKVINVAVPYGSQRWIIRAYSLVSRIEEGIHGWKQKLVSIDTEW